MPMTDARFEAFVSRHQDMVYATALRLLGNRPDAEDVAQTVFLRAFERFEEIGSSPSAAGWLKTVTTNLCLNHLSRYRFRWRFFSEMGRDETVPGPKGPGLHEAGLLEAALGVPATHANDFETADEQARLARALRRLPAKQRVPLVLFHFEDKSYQEIADLLGRSLVKVKTDIHRGRQALKRTLENPDGSRRS